MKWSNNIIQMHLDSNLDSNRKDSIALFYALCTFNKLLDHFKSQHYFFCLEYLYLTDYRIWLKYLRFDLKYLFYRENN